MSFRRTLVTLCTVASALGPWAAVPTQTAREIPLDLPADFAPVFCGERVYLFSSNGRNQVMGPSDEAPQCSPIQFSPAIQPVCGPEGPSVLDGEGNLWQLGKGLPHTAASGLSGAVAVLPGPGGNAYVFPDRVQRPDGSVTALPVAASKALALGGGWVWAWGGGWAALVDGAGRLLWTWKPARGEPGPAVLGADKIVAGTSAGDLVALRKEDGKVLFSYRAGGAILSPPLLVGDTAVCATLDHFVRAIHLKRGDLVWQFRTAGRASFGPLGTPAGLLFAESSGTRIFLLSPDKGDKVWEWQAQAGSILASPAVSGHTAAVVTWGEAANPTLYLVTLPASPPQAKAK
jgi:hypothetical protein